MPRFTDEQVEAACEKFKRLYPLTGFGREFPDSMRSVLTAAADAAPAVDVLGFEIAVIELIEACDGYATERTIGSDDRHRFMRSMEVARQRLLDMFKGAAR